MSDNQINPLVNGIAVIIDDKIGTGEDLIDDLITQIEGKGMPCVKIHQLPVSAEGFIAHIHGVSFILLDWELSNTQTDENGIPLVDISAELFESANIEFLQKIRKTLFVPVFIFTNRSPEDIRDKLGKKLYHEDGKPNFIFIQRKSELTGNRLFDRIDDWIKENPPIYVLKTWDREYRTAQSRLFADFYAINPSWVAALKEGFAKDNPALPSVSAEIMMLIRDNLYSRMSMLGLTAGLQDVISKHKPTEIKPEEIGGIFERGKFLQDHLLADEIHCGDVFLSEESGQREYFINIRRECDCISRDRNSTDEIELYLIKGSIFEVTKKNIEMSNGGEPHTRNVVFFMHNGNSVVFNFKKFIIKKSTKTMQGERETREIAVPKGDKEDAIKAYRVGRLLPPYLTHLLQSFASFLQGQDLPRNPLVAVSQKE
jgi:hypothetical protein